MFVNCLRHQLNKITIRIPNHGNLFVHFLESGNNLGKTVRDGNHFVRSNAKRLEDVDAQFLESRKRLRNIRHRQSDVATAISNDQEIAYNPQFGPSLPWEYLKSFSFSIPWTWINSTSPSRFCILSNVSCSSQPCFGYPR